MNQTSIIAGALVVAYIVFITVRGDLVRLFQVIGIIPGIAGDVTGLGGGATITTTSSTTSGGTSSTPTTTPISYNPGGTGATPPTLGSSSGNNAPNPEAGSGQGPNLGGGPTLPSSSSSGGDNSSNGDNSVPSSDNNLPPGFEGSSGPLFPSGDTGSTGGASCPDGYYADPESGGCLPLEGNTQPVGGQWELQPGTYPDNGFPSDTSGGTTP